MRSGLALVAMGLGYASIAATFGFAISSANPSLAHKLAPWDGRITAKLAEEELRLDTKAAPQSVAARLARIALLQDPTAVSAVATLGLQRQLRGDVAGARRTFAYSQALSRRDLRTQLWAIEDAVSREDIPGALHHYDIALRFSDQGKALLFPILATAVSDASVRSAAVRTLTSQPPWAPSFLEYLANEGDDPSAAALVLQDLAKAGQPLSGLVRALVVQKLQAQGLIEDAWRFYASFRSGVHPTKSRDPRFAAGLADPTVFDWQSVATDGRVAVIRLGLVDVSAPPSVGGALMQQLQKLPPGIYRMTGHSIAIEQSETSLPYWWLACSDGRELGRITVTNSSRNGGNFAGFLNVPADCPLQILALIARSSDDASGFSGQIDYASLEPDIRNRQQSR